MTEALYEKALAAHAAMAGFDEAAEARAAAWVALNDAGQTYDQIAARMGVSKQAVGKVVLRVRPARDASPARQSASP